MHVALTLTLHSMMSHWIISSFPSRTANPKGVSPELVAGAVASESAINIYEYPRALRHNCANSLCSNQQTKKGH